MRIHHTSPVTDAAIGYENRNEYSSTYICIAKEKQAKKPNTETASCGSES